MSGDETPRTTEIEPSNDGFLPASTGRSLPIALLRAREAVMERFRPMLARHDITEQQWRVLRVLGETGRMEASRVAQEACILAPSLTRISRTLEAAGLIESERDCDDGRRTLLAISSAGRRLIADVSPEGAEIYAVIEAAIGKQAVLQLLDALEHVQARLKPGRSER